MDLQVVIAEAERNDGKRYKSEIETLLIQCSRNNFLSHSYYQHFKNNKQNCDLAFPPLFLINELFPSTIIIIFHLLQHSRSENRFITLIIS